MGLWKSIQNMISHSRWNKFSFVSAYLTFLQSRLKYLCVMSNLVAWHRKQTSSNGFVVYYSLCVTEYVIFWRAYERVSPSLSEREIEREKEWERVIESVSEREWVSEKNQVGRKCFCALYILKQRRITMSVWERRVQTAL